MAHKPSLSLTVRCLSTRTIRHSGKLEGAVEVYQSLPKLLGANGENAVPVKVWLLPLTCLDSTAAKLVRQISIGLVQECQSVLEDFSDLEMRCNDALRTQTAQQFPQIGKKLKTFKQKCSEFKLEFQQTLAKKLPSIRGGGEEEAVLAEILRKTCSSPFNSKDLNEWMDCKEREISILKSYTNMMKNTQIVPRENDLHEKFSMQSTLCVLSSPRWEVMNRTSQLYQTTFNKHPNQTMPKIHTLQIREGTWYSRKSKKHEKQSKALQGQQGEQEHHISDSGFNKRDTERCQHLPLYRRLSVSENFEPPSKPATVTGSDINHSSVTLKISPPRFGAEDITSYSVEYCVSGEDGWKQETASKAEEVPVSGLSPNTEYMFRCRAETPVGAGPANEVSGSIKTLPCSPPGKLHVESNSREISVSWEKPAELGQDVHVLSYIVEYAKPDQQVKEEDLHWEQMMARAEKAIISGLQPETEYAVRVRCDCGAAGRSKESIAVNVGTTKRDRLKESLKSKSKRINSESPSVYKLPLTEEDMDVDGCRGYAFGKESMRQNRTIMILGATGSGKSTLINGLINYIVGVEWEDDFRFKLVDEDQSRSQAESQTSEVTVYKINHQEGFKIPFSLTVVDTPGFGDTRGIGRDKEITEQIRRLFTSANGVSEIDAVCFVTQASLARLTATQRYVFDSVLSIFGKDVAENIQMLVTFADGKQPPVLEAINHSRVPCPKNELGFPVHFKFNNSAFFADNRSSNERASDENSDEDDDDFDEMFWKMGIKSMEKFFNALAKLTTKSLLMTQEVLKERRHLEAAVEGLQPQVKAGLAKLEQIKTTKEKIKEHETAMTSNENFVIEVDVIKPVKKQLTKKGEYITNCQNCSITCHYPCMIADNSQKHGCASMDSSGRCTVCPGKCIWNIQLGLCTSKRSQTLEELKVKYNKAAKEKMTVQELIESQEEEIDQLQEMIVSLMDQSSNSLTRLQEIALRPNPLTTPDYIDMLIEGEKAEAKVGYQARVRSLEEMREKATIISRVANRQKLTKTEEELSREKQETQKKKGFLKKVANFFGY
ncbi:hypothetical protein F7725_010936 [Dissostichus mawsoni]|uniref:Fibronectin type-III domain-containing protein n=1 Tax=Dissostichus mawsoni TaxID=36200 RepID=A0A7J5Z7J3_DISMA|nr:hypothetical protein F7725_010936 [Dissostichus mawsoni]